MLKITDKKNLIDKWAYEYVRKLKPSLLIGTFRFANSENLGKLARTRLKYRAYPMGGEPGADVLTTYLRPEELTLYTEENISTLIKKFHLLPDSQGNVKVYQKFWNKTL